MYKALVFFTLASLFIACDKVEGPYRETNTSTPDDTTSGGVVKVRKVLVEDYTGHLCGNCPAAAQALDSIVHNNEGKVIPLAVHAGYFARVLSGNYSYDFRTPESVDLDNFFGISTAGNPNGMVNRSGFASQTHIIAYTVWKDSVQSKLSRPAEASFELSVAYNSTTRAITCTTKVEFLKDISEPLKLCVYLTEDSIVQYQTDYAQPSGQQDVSGYVHMHALRTSLNSVWGEAVTTGPVVKDQTFTKNHTYTIPANYVDHNCNIVVFVYNTVTNEVIQADMKPVVQ